MKEKERKSQVAPPFAHTEGARDWNSGPWTLGPAGRCVLEGIGGLRERTSDSKLR